MKQYEKCSILKNTPVTHSATTQPICHFTPMTYESADDWPDGQVEFWECPHCGHTKEVGHVVGGL